MVGVGKFGMSLPNSVGNLFIFCPWLVCWFCCFDLSMRWLLIFFELISPSSVLIVEFDVYTPNSTIASICFIFIDGCCEV